jgi:hypothetical protein
MAFPLPSPLRRMLEWLVYARRDGQFHELTALAATYEPPSAAAYRHCLPAVLAVPQRPLIMAIVIDYLRVAPWPFSRYREATLLLASSHRGHEGWFPLIMPVTTWLARQGGHHLGFPKFITPSIELVDDGHEVRGTATGECGGPFALDMRFTPGLPRPLHDWEERIVADPALFQRPFHVLKPAGVGPAAAEVWFDHRKPPTWEARTGSVVLRGHEEDLIPPGTPVLGRLHRFRGGMNLVSRPLS